MKRGQIDEMIGVLREQLLAKRMPGKIWRGELSSSAISTSVSVFALHTVDKEKYAPYIQKGSAWLIETMKEDGSWGDTIESPSNMTATLLSYTTLCAVGKAPQVAKDYLTDRFGGYTDQHIIRGVLDYYGTDLTFSAPILVMCALAGIISSWDKIPQLPFELAVMPQRFFRFLQLPVVSYAIPALIAVGILRHRKGKKNILSPIRESFIPKSLKVLEKLQPVNGGFLEAAPLTAFVAMCMSGAGYRQHIATQKGVGFLIDTVRDDGSWPIDTDLASWMTALSVRALGNDLPEKEELAMLIRQNAFTHKHSFTGAKEGGWGWTDLPGAAPDADDTSGALVALHILLDGVYCPEVGKGIEWLLDLQNSDGGMPTFCKGWGKLPFDRSSPDISAHTLLAFQLWMERLPADLQRKCRKSMSRLLRWMQKIQATDGSWTPLWFGDQDAGDERSPVYATAMTVEYLSDCDDPIAREMVRKGLAYLLATQNADGGWGGAKDVPSKVTLTARALSALASYPETDSEVMKRAFNYLYEMYQAGELFRAEPIGLYFSRLWYSEEMYNITFVLNALKKYKLNIS
ncbi:prenyltransferase beta subunit [Parabacteroides sp. PFB2-12]|uniref:prenyltransferase/squalene oxidase repeat-containing protein n=1 Tax=unclassified Parabacteroides TaxID=2649774 RepID=UPI0024754D7C|nr:MULTISPECIES: prenyltransferase/squalene oxidase repeat-containing protein [unclassified Parabacteroides]MDH6342127.1 prenyltransferase beta subunit [Parabacteroides sp. PM6-13]MDH6389546.1 prenyltransferase beta subunit [Parabacteroides sp. PFB2-12]